MGYGEIKSCGTDTPTVSTQLSDDGLQVTFCSDSTESAKGFHLLAYVLSNSVPVSTSDVNKREITSSEVGYN